MSPWRAFWMGTSCLLLVLCALACFGLAITDSEFLWAGIDPNPIGRLYGLFVGLLASFLAAVLAFVAWMER